MKIVINGYIGKKITGIGRNLIEIIKRINHDKNEIILYTNYDNYELIKLEFANLRIEKINVSKTSRLKNIFYNFFVFPFYTLKENADVVYIVNFLPLFIKFKKTVVLLHDLIEYNIPNKFGRIQTIYRKLIIPTLIYNSDHIITVSSNSKNDIIKHFGICEKNITVIYDGVDLMPSLSNNNVRIRNDEEYILYVGTVDYPGKNVHGIIKSFELFIERYEGGESDIKLYLVGMKGKGYSVIEKLVKSSKYNANIVLKGYVTDENLISLYMGARAFLFLSYYEGFGIPIIEAMNFSIPSIVSNSSCLPEIAGDAAFIVNPDDYDQISIYINQIIKHKFNFSDLEIRMKKNLKRFDWEKSAEQTIKILSKYAKK